MKLCLFCIGTFFTLCVFAGESNVHTTDPYSCRAYEKKDGKLFWKDAGVVEANRKEEAIQEYKRISKSETVTCEKMGFVSTEHDAGVVDVDRGESCDYVGQACKVAGENEKIVYGACQVMSSNDDYEGIVCDAEDAFHP